MLRSRPAVASAALAAALGLSLVTVSGAQAATRSKTKTVTACVNKKSGATTVLLGKKAKKKCKRGWTKVTWSVSGKNGKSGAPGTNGTPGKNGTSGTNGANGIGIGTNGTNGTDGKDGVALRVRDANGTVIGSYAGLYPGAPFPIYSVFSSDGGLYNYFPTGQVLALPTGNATIFADSACTGTAYASVGTGLPAGFIGLFLGPARVVVRSSTGGDMLTGLGPTRAWKFTTSTQTVPNPVPAYYELNPTTGACGAVTNPVSVGSTLIALASVPAPPDGVGSLSIGS